VIRKVLIIELDYNEFMTEKKSHEYTEHEVEDAAASVLESTHTELGRWQTVGELLLAPGKKFRVGAPDEDALVGEVLNTTPDGDSVVLFDGEDEPSTIRGNQIHAAKELVTSRGEFITVTTIGVAGLAVWLRNHKK